MSAGHLVHHGVHGQAVVDVDEEGLPLGDHIAEPPCTPTLSWENAAGSMMARSSAVSV